MTILKQEGILDKNCSDHLGSMPKLRHAPTYLPRWRPSVTQRDEANLPTYPRDKRDVTHLNLLTWPPVGGQKILGNF